MNDHLKWRHADKPIRMPQDQLDKMDDGNYIATLKYDGYRCLIDWDGENLQFRSRRDLEKGGPSDHPVSDELRSEVKQFFLENEIPAGTRLDAEWLARRTDGPENLRIFGIYYLNNTWVGKDPEAIRFAQVKAWKYNQPHVQMVDYVETGFKDFFEQHRIYSPEAEGIVLKHKTSSLVGNRKMCKLNDLWFKIKWRDGSDGKSHNTF